jgi:nucleoside 2-deoxyribosyltransferase
MAKVYIAGPISYIRDAFVTFDKAEKSLAYIGHKPFNPTLIQFPMGKEEEGEFNRIGEWAYFMKRCIPELVTSDKVLMLEGWEESKGARLEKELAEKLKIPIYYTIEEIEG